MKIRNLLFSVAMIAATGMLAQSVPTHEMYVDFGEKGNPNELKNKYKQAIDEDAICAPYEVGAQWMKVIDTWEPGKPWSTKTSGYYDDNFFISRVRLKDRFYNDATEVSGLNKDTEKKLCWWAPIGDLTKQWGPLPRYNFDSDNFNMWQYIDIQGNWSNTWFRTPGTFNDVAHKNGVVTGCLYFIDWAAPVNANSFAGEPLAKLCEKADGKFKYARKLVQMLKYYGIDGIGINPEGSWSSSLNNDFQDFLAECHRIAREEENWPFRVDWYAFVSNTGSLNDNGCKLDDYNNKWFDKDGEKVTDMFFLNYNWSESQLATSEAAARKLNRDPRDVYAGFDQQGRGYGLRWTSLAKYPISIVVWGAHDRSQLYISSTEGGSGELAVQNEYQKKQEMLFTGGTRNVLNTPAITDQQTTATFNDLATWHGYSKFVTAKSTLNELPFVTRFNLGNGLSFKKEGKVTFDHKWYNIGMQDYLPTWRWWIEDGAGNVPADAIQCDFNFEDAWFGGSCLKVHGATTKSDIHLFKTKFPITKSDEVSVTYKVVNGTDPHMKLMFSEVGAESTFKSVDLPVTDGRGQWKTATFRVRNLTSGDGEIACISLSVTNTSDDYEVLIGELSVGGNIETKPLVTPVITHAEPLKRVYNSVDAKIIFDCPFAGARPAEYEGCPVYNEEVGIWYFEIYIQQEGFEPIMLTTTTSWAAYVIEAVLSDPNDPYFKLGVRAVAPNGKDGSDIVWSDKMTIDITPVETLKIDKSIIKPNEEFTIGFEDPTHAPVKFELIEASTGEVVDSKDNVIEITTSLPNLGCYDVQTTIDGVSSISRGLVLITPEEVGRLPRITSITADKTEANADEDVKISHVRDEGTNEGNATASQAAFIQDAYAIKVGGAIKQYTDSYTYALWIKTDKFSHGALGTSIMQKLDKNAGWTEGVWGEMYTVVHSAAEMPGVVENEIRVMVNAPAAGTLNFEHQNEVHDGCASTGYRLLPGVWNHIALTFDAVSNTVELYINGKQAFSKVSKWKPRSKYSNTPFYVGGSMTNVAGFTGWVDELQIWNKPLTATEVKECMEGYSIAPEGLQGYFDFESIEVDTETGKSYFPNLGNNTAVDRAQVIEWKKEGDTTIDEPVNPVLALGVPMMEGVRPVTFESAKWILDGASIFNTDDNGNAVVQYDKDGKYPVTLTLTNSWGSTSKTLYDYITISGGTGVEGNETVENMLIYPNPFVESVNILFASDGKYSVDVFNVNGQKVGTQAYEVSAGQACNLSFKAPEGLYYVMVMQNGKCIKTFKVSKSL